MAILTELPVAAATELLREYELTLVELVPLSAGSVNSNFFLTALTPLGERQSLFARIYEEQGDEGAEFELKLNEILAKNGISVAQPLRKQNGELFARFEDKPFAIYQRLTGEVTCQACVTKARCYSVGEALARVHSADLCGLPLKPSRFGKSQIRERLERVRTSGRASLMGAVERILSRVEELESARDSALPQGLIHGDLFRDNVLLNGEKVSGLLDFESASQGSYSYDLMVTILAWCFGSELESELLQAMLRGYTSVRPLSAQERAALVVEGSVACMRFATTRLTDFSLRVADGTAPLRDYRRFLARDAALRSGIMEGALAEL